MSATCLCSCVRGSHEGHGSSCGTRRDVTKRVCERRDTCHHRFFSNFLNAFAERFVLSVKSECLDRIVPLGEAHLRAAVSAFVHHYHDERPHQGLSNDLIAVQPRDLYL